MLRRSTLPLPPRLPLLLLLMTSSTFVTSQPGVSVTISNEMIKEFVDTHNQKRRLMNASDMMEIVWDNTIAEAAKNSTSLCYFGNRHEGYDRDNPKLRGLGILHNKDFSNTGTHNRTVKQIVEAWASRGETFSRDTRKCATQNPFCTSFEQVIWGPTDSIGCGGAMCSGELYILCFYNPSALNGPPAYSAGAPCSACPETAKHCRMGLCSKRGSDQDSAAMSLKPSIATLTLTLTLAHVVSS